MNVYIYKISSPNTDDIYIGSTIQSLHRRLSLHYCQKPNTSKKVLDAGDAKIELLESVCVNNIKDLDYYIEDENNPEVCMFVFIYIYIFIYIYFLRMYLYSYVCICACMYTCVKL